MGGLFLEPGDEVGAVALFIVVFSGVLVSGAIVEHVVEESSQFGSEAFDGAGRIHARAQAAAEGTQGAFAWMAAWAQTLRIWAARLWPLWGLPRRRLPPVIRLSRNLGSTVPLHPTHMSTCTVHCGTSG